MKKNLILLFCMSVGLTACQKENASTTSTEKTNFHLKSIHDATLPPTYTDLTLMSDGSYQGVWNSCSIKVTHPSWDQVKYPTLQNGVPVVAEGMSTYDGSSWIDASNTGTSGNVFQVSQIIGSLAYTAFNSTDFHSDIAKYATAVNTWISGGQLGPIPDISTYVMGTYTTTVGTSQVKTYTGKLIRVTTGSHLAIANMSYPLPAANTVPTNQLTFNITDPSTGQSYAVKGSHDVLTSATEYGTTTSRTITGTYTIDSVGNITAIGTIIRADGTTFNFNRLMEI